VQDIGYTTYIGHSSIDGTGRARMFHEVSGDTGGSSSVGVVVVLVVVVVLLFCRG
jgi:hypothetical protein